MHADLGTCMLADWAIQETGEASWNREQPLWHDTCIGALLGSTRRELPKPKGQSSDYNRLSVKMIDDLLICPHLISLTCNDIDQIAAITRLPFHISVEGLMANLVMVQCTFPSQNSPQRTHYLHVPIKTPTCSPSLLELTVMADFLFVELTNIKASGESGENLLSFVLDRKENEEQ